MGGSGTSDPTGDPTAAACPPLPGRLWRLSDDQYVNAVSDLLPGAQIAAVPTPGRNPYEFIDTPGKLPVTGSLTPLLRVSAKSAANQALTTLALLAPCALTEGSPDCAARFIDDFVTRAFRRPLLEAERARLLGLYAVGAARGHAEGVRLLIEATLQSGSFLYRLESGGAAPPALAEVRPLSAFELASSLSFFLLDSLPDSSLWSKAVDGTLATPAVYGAEVERLLALPRVQQNLARVLSRWLKLDRILVSERATLDFPNFNALRPAMLDESRRFFTRLLTQGGTLGDVFTSRTAELTPQLAAFYGVASPAGSEPTVTVELPSEQRAGVLTQASLIGSIKASNRSVHRGLFVLREMLCGDIPPPPASVDTQPPSPDVDTEREFADYRRSQGTCGSCHGAFDGVDLSFERHDALGRYQANDPAGNLVDASATVTLDGSQISIGGVAELGALLAKSPDVRSCVARKLTGYATGRATSPECVVRVTDRVQTQAGSLLELFRAIAQDPLFFQREVAP